MGTANPLNNLAGRTLIFGFYMAFPKVIRAQFENINWHNTAGWVQFCFDNILNLLVKNVK